MSQQSFFLTYAAPDDGSVKSMHIPRRIQRLTVNPNLCAREREKQKALAFDSTHPLPFPHTNMVCDIDIFPDGLEHAMIQVQGLEFVPFSEQTANDDREVFSNVVWNVADPDAQIIAHGCSATSNQVELAALLERIACFHLRVLEREIPIDHPSRAGQPYKGLFRFASQIPSLARAGKLPFWQPQWEKDTSEVLAAASEPFADVVDMKVLSEIGENLVAIVKGNQSAIDLARRAKLMKEWYTTGCGVANFTTRLARTLNQIVHRFPQMHILEIRAEMGAATGPILHEIGTKFASYTVTAPTSSSFDPAQAWLEMHKDKIIFKPSDDLADLQEPGFFEASYDLVVASLALHATPNLRKTLRDARRLLKPGGHLLVLELLPPLSAFIGVVFGAVPNGWLNTEEGQTSSLTVAPIEWNSLLRDTGFSGVDTSTLQKDDLIPFSIFVSQAVDDKIAFLRDPLSLTFPASAAEMAIEDLLILGGNSLKTTRLVSRLSTSLEPYCKSIRTARSLPDFLSVDTSPKTVVLSLADVDASVFKELNNEKWAALKKMMLHIGTLIWVTRGRLAENPYANMMLGLVRGTARDNPAFDYLLLDIEDARQVGQGVIAETILRHHAASQWQQRENMNLTIENELALDKEGRLLIPRLMMNPEMNDRYNSNRRGIRSRITPSLNNVGISMSDSGWDVELKPPSRRTEGESMQLQTTHSFLAPVRIAEFGCMFIILGKCNCSGESVVALSPDNHSHIRSRKELSIPVRVSSGSEARFLWLTAHHLLASIVLRGLSKDDKVLIFEPSHEFASIVSKEATLLGVQVTFATTNREGLVMHGPNWVVIHPAASERAITHVAHKSFSVFIDMTSHIRTESLGDRIASALPIHSRKENLKSFFGNMAWNPTISHLQEIHSRFAKSVAWASTVVAEPTGSGSEQVTTVAIDCLPGGRERQVPQTVIEWTAGSKVSAKVRPVDSQVSFSDDKTYWIVGLTGGLGLSLCEWMVQLGARYLAISSRKPSVETTWLDEMRARGVLVKIFAW